MTQEKLTMRTLGVALLSQSPTAAIAAVDGWGYRLVSWRCEEAGKRICLGVRSASMKSDDYWCYIIRGDRSTFTGICVTESLLPNDRKFPEIHLSLLTIAAHKSILTCICMRAFNVYLSVHSCV